jgi:hypothetical protein
VGLFDRTSSTTNQTLVDQTTTTTTQTDQSGGLLTFSDIAGAVGIDLSDRSVTQNTLSDAGAIAAGRDVGLAGVDAARSSVNTLANSYGQSLTVLERVNADSLDLLGALANNAIDASKTIARDSASSSASFVEQAIAGFGELAQQTSESGDDKIARVVGFALAAIAAVIVLPAVFKGGGRAAVI